MCSTFLRGAAGASLLMAPFAAATGCSSSSGNDGAAGLMGDAGASDATFTEDATTQEDASGGSPADASATADADAAAFTGLNCTVTPCVVELAAGGGHVCALLQDHSVRCWGQNYAGELGTGTIDGGMVTPAQLPVPTTVAGLPSAVEVAAGGFNNGFGTSCATTFDSGALCWGSNMNGVLGLGPSDGSAPPLSIAPLPLDFEGVSALSLGGLFGCALASDGGVSCWGDDTSGELGRAVDAGSFDPQPTPVPLSGFALAVATGISHACAIMADRSVACWGAADHGEVGRVGDGGLSMPQIVAGVSATALSAGEVSTCAITPAGGVVCWGGDLSGQLGRGDAAMPSIDPTPRPVALPAGLTAVQITSSVGSTCAVMSDRSVWCWGDNAYGEIGTGSSVPGTLSTPAPVQGLANVVQVASGPGANTICALVADGSVRCWGVNYADQLGIDTSGDAAQPDQSPHATPIRITF